MENLLSGSWKFDGDGPTQGCFLLKELSVVEVTGSDAGTFLHGQFTNHIINLADEFRLAAYCQPQGRVLALMRVAKIEKCFYLILPKDLVLGFIKRLSMFVLRSDVKIREADELCVCGLIDGGVKLPEIDHVQIDENMFIGRVADWGEQKRALVIGRINAVQEQFNIIDDSAVWFASEIKTGTPWIFDQTKAAFVPQWINLEWIGGLVFDKGCYPGQEVISRIQHIGKTPRRMVMAYSSKSSTLTPGEVVQQNSQPVGSVVMSVQTDRGTLALFVVSLSNIKTEAFIVKDSEFKIQEAFPLTKSAEMI